MKRRLVIERTRKGSVAAKVQVRIVGWLPIYRTERREFFGAERACYLALAKRTTEYLNRTAGGAVPRHERRRRARELMKVMS